MEEGLESKERRLREMVSAHPSAVVAYSGGVDSTLLARIAREELGDRMLALVVSSPLMPVHDLERAVHIAEELGFPFHILEANELRIPRFADNDPDRCYQCKKYRLGLLKAEAAKRGFSEVLDGSNMDDASAHRPGTRALEEEGVSSPLRRAGLTKAEVRALARKLGLPNWDAPSSPCLATRFPYGMRLTIPLLRRVEAAEDHLRNLGMRVFRVRLEGPEWARIEAGGEERSLLENKETGEQAVKNFREAGFRRVDLDLDGYRSGSMDEPKPRRRVLTLFEDGSPAAGDHTTLDKERSSPARLERDER